MSSVLFHWNSIIFSVLLIGTLWSANLHAQKPNRTKFKRDNRAPRIIPDVENHDITVNSDLQLSCLGSKRLEWKPPSSRSGEVEIVNYVDQDNEKERLGRPQTPGSNYRSELHIHSARVTDTGTYTCFHVGEDEIEGGFTSINVFVNDPRQLFVSLAPPSMPPTMPAFITLHEHKPGLIPCRPTNSKAEVSLIRFDGKVIGDATFYAAEGFTIPFPNVFFSGDFMCRYRVGDLKDEQRLHLTYVANSEAPTPVIDTSQAKHVTAGREFRLMCNATVHQDTMLELNWDFPSPSTRQRATYATQRYDRENANYRYTLFVSTVIIRDVDQNLDDGTYRCTAEVISNREKRSFTEVKIKPYSMGIESHIKMTPEPISGVLQVQIHQPALLAVLVDAHPTPKFTWKLNGVPILPNTPRYAIGTMGNYERLRIQGAQGIDQGNFTLEAVAGDTRSEVNITLLVNEPPTVSLDTPGVFYMVGRPAIFKCTVRAFPMPHIVWKFQPCNRYCTEGGWEKSDFLWKIQPAENVSTTTDLSGRVSTSRFHSTIGELGSGYIRCETDSNHVDQNVNIRSSHATMRVLATDVENGFRAEMIPHNPVELQNIIITCVVNNYEFSDVQWEVLSPVGNDYRPVATSSSVIAQSAQSSIFSDTHTLRIMHADGRISGQYRCAARRRSGETPLRSQVFDLRNLYPSTTLTFVDGNNGVEKMNVKYEGKMELECRVNGSPPPQFEWTKDGVAVEESQVVRIENGGSRLVSHKVTPETEGQYTCRAYHAKSSVSKTWKIDVEGDSATRRRTIIIASVVTPLIVLMCIVVLVIWLKYRKERTRRKELEYLEKIINNDTANPTLIDPNAPLSDQVALLNYDDRWELPRENLKIHNKILGSGQFGKVMRGEAKDLMGHPGELMIVAVKMLKEKADIVQRKALLGEIKVMMHIGQHLNVVNLLGACTKTITKGELFMIMEFCQNGSLQKFLQNHVGERFYNQLDLATMKAKPLGDDQLDEINQIKRRLVKSDSKFDGKIVTTRDLICYSFQVSNGMEYLAKHKVIHRDLAARNVLVAENDVVKICDFGLAREDYTYVKKSQAVIPVKWVAIESIYDNVFTTESDVWAFGILMWEIFTLGSTPYPGHEANSTFVERVRNGLRMDHPYLAPKEIYDIMRHCWEASPYARPSFSALSAHLGNLLDQAIVQRYLDMNTPFEQFNEEVLVTDDAGYINDPVNRNSQISTGNGATYANTYRMLPGSEQPQPSKPRRHPRARDSAGDTVDAMELQPMLTRHSPKPSRPGNETDSGDYLNQDFINPKRNMTPVKAVVEDVDETALSTRTVTPSDSFASGGRRYPNAGDARTNFLYGANPVRFPKTSEV